MPTVAKSFEFSLLGQSTSASIVSFAEQSATREYYTGSRELVGQQMIGIDRQRAFEGAPGTVEIFSRIDAHPLGHHVIDAP